MSHVTPSTLERYFVESCMDFFSRIFVKKYDDYVLQPPCAWGGVLEMDLTEVPAMRTIAQRLLVQPSKREWALSGNR